MPRDLSLADKDGWKVKPIAPRYPVLKFRISIPNIGFYYYNELLHSNYIYVFRMSWMSEQHCCFSFGRSQVLISARKPPILTDFLWPFSIPPRNVRDHAEN
jgi:hypothetical protein